MRQERFSCLQVRSLKCRHRAMDRVLAVSPPACQHLLKAFRIFPIIVQDAAKTGMADELGVSRAS
jgi:hypothetical protein